MSDMTAKALGKPKLQVGNGYPANFDQMARLLDASGQDERAKIPIADLAERLGLASRQMECVISIASAFGLVVPVRMRLTPIGKLILDNDHFFDDIGTLWFVHYVVASNPRLIVWNRFSNCFLPENIQFSVVDLRLSYVDLKSNYSEQSAIKHVNKEINTILDAYTNQQFSRLAYLTKREDIYALSYRQPVPPLVIAASIARFLEWHRPGETAVTIEDLVSAPNSPGVIFQIPEPVLRASLELLRKEVGFSLESRADLDQVRLTDSISDYIWMERYYASR